jgi:hypothetical protein
MDLTLFCKRGFPDVEVELIETVGSVDDVEFVGIVVLTVYISLSPFALFEIATIGWS